MQISTWRKKHTTLGAWSFCGTNLDKLRKRGKRRTALMRKMQALVTCWLYRSVQQCMNSSTFQLDAPRSNSRLCSPFSLWHWGGKGGPTPVLPSPPPRGEAGEMRSVEGDLETMVAGLACGVPSSVSESDTNREEVHLAVVGKTSRHRDPILGQVHQVHHPF